MTLYLDPAYDVPQLHQSIQAIRSGDVSRVTQIESSDYTRVYRFELSGCSGNTTLYYKEFLFRSLRDRLSVILRKSRARRAWSGAKLLLDHRFHTARPVVVGEERAFGLVQRSFLITEAMEGARNFDTYLEERRVSGPRDFEGIRHKRSLITLLGKTIGRMHRIGIFQGDLRVRNILVQDGDKLRVGFIDNERTVQRSHLSKRKMLKNLVQVNMILSPAVNTADRVRFFLAYLQENPALADSREARRVWMGKIQKRAEKRLTGKGYI